MTPCPGHRDEPTALYRLFGDGGTLVYVGVAKVFGSRWNQHAKSQPWWHEVRRQTIEWFPSREAAETAERLAISNEQPRRNIQGKLGVQRVGGARMTIQRHRREWLAARVRDLREQLELSQSGLADLMSAAGHGWHQSTVYKVEHVRRPLWGGEAFSLAHICGMSLEELFAGIPRAEVPA